MTEKPFPSLRSSRQSRHADAKERSDEEAASTNKSEVVMRIPFQLLGRPVAGSAAAAVLILGLVTLALQLSSPARAQSTMCNVQVTSAPTGPATVSVSSTTAFGKVLVAGSGAYEGCSLYLLTSDQLHTLTGSHFACSDGLNAKNLPCDTVLWPALLTDGAPIAGPGVNPKLLGTVTRTDLPGLGGPVQQVTYAGLPLYRFNKDEDPGETEGANIFDPLTSPTGIWYLVEPNRGNPAPGTALLQNETAPLGGTETNKTVLAATMDEDFTPFLSSGGGTFPVYTSSPGHGPGKDAGPAGPGLMGPGGPCQALCAQYWPPVLTSGKPQAGTGVDQHALGTIKRPDGTQQVTYSGRPLYLFADDAYIPGLSYNGGPASINGAGANTLWGVFNTIPPSS
jgi:predicted lipoprotein with Yx(FWY)xxD motif